MVTLLQSPSTQHDRIKKDQITLGSDVTVNGTLLKAGDYEVRFNEQTGELAILKDGKVKARTTARLAARNEKAKNTLVRTRTVGSTSELIWCHLRRLDSGYCRNFAWRRCYRQLIGKT